MARRKKHEEHVNHEAWAIPYGDLITLLLAFFVVMYSMSSVNEGKYRILSDSLVAAFRGAPKTLAPINIGQEATGKGGDAQLQGIKPTVLMKLRDPRPVPEAEEELERMKMKPRIETGIRLPMAVPQQPGGTGNEVRGALIRMAQEVEQALQSLIDQKLVVVRQEKLWIEVEIRTDILFASGESQISPTAVNVLQQIATILKPFPNPVRVEGHTDNRPITTKAFPSNWELSAARAASVVHLFTRAGMDPARLAVIGLGENRPAQSNATAEGRNANRRVLLVILGGNNRPEGDYAGERGQESEEPATVPEALPKPASVEASLPSAPTNNPV